MAPIPSQTVVPAAPGARTRHRDTSGVVLTGHDQVPLGDRLRDGHASGYQPVPQRIPMTVSGSVSGQRSNDRGERVGRAGAEDEVGEADLLPSPLDFLGCRRRVSGEDGQ